MDTAYRLNELLARLKRRGNRLTPQRVAIIQAIVNHEGHPTVEQIHTQIQPDFPTTSLATVYKTISLLKQAHEVLELGFGELGSRYDARKPYPHPHMICTRCGLIIDSEWEGINDQVEQMARKTGFTISNHRFDLFGLCMECKKEE